MRARRVGATVTSLGLLAASLGSVACLEQLAVSSYSDVKQDVLKSPPAVMTLASIDPPPGSTIPITAFKGTPPGGIRLTFDVLPSQKGEYLLYVSFDCREGSDAPGTCEQGSTHAVLQADALQQVTVHMANHDHHYSNIVGGTASLTLWSMIQAGQGTGAYVTASAAVDLPFQYTVTR